jgi:hypothetical protein
MSTETQRINPTDVKQQTSCLEDMQCGKLGLSIVSINTVALGVFATNLALYGSLLGAVSLTCSAIILPSMMLFGVKNYLHYITKPLSMGAGFALAFFTVSVDPKTGIWTGANADWAHFHDKRLCSALGNFFKSEKAESIVDMGCGTGDYVKGLKKQGFACDGFDGNPDTPKLSDGVCKIADLTTKDLQLREDGKKYDWVLSLEVGEHLPKEHEDTFLKNITGHAKDGLVLSWAKKGQGGLGHVNEQDNAYIESKLAELNWKRDFKAEENLRRQTSPHCFWYRDTVMVFRPV